MRFFYYLLSYAMVSIILSFAHAQIKVVTDTTHPIYNLPPEAQIIYLVAANPLYDELSVNLPSEPDAAVKIAKARLEKAGKPLQQAIQKALQGVVDAWALGITKIPAVIVNDRYVVYGESDVNKALSLIEQHKQYKEKAQ